MYKITIQHGEERSLEEVFTAATLAKRLHGNS